MLSCWYPTVCLSMHMIVPVTIFHTCKCTVKQIMGCLCAYANRPSVERDVVHELVLEVVQFDYLLLVGKVTVSDIFKELFQL